MNKFLDLHTIIASLGVIFATTTFISGLQVAKREKQLGTIMTMMHRVNGYVTFIIYVVIATLTLSTYDSIQVWPVIGWFTGFFLMALKVLTVRNEKFYKYASRVGLLLFIVWIVIIYKQVT